MLAPFVQTCLPVLFSVLLSLPESEKGLGMIGQTDTMLIGANGTRGLLRVAYWRSRVFVLCRFRVGSSVDSASARYPNYTAGCGGARARRCEARSQWQPHRERNVEEGQCTQCLGLIELLDDSHRVAIAGWSVENLWGQAIYGSIYGQVTDKSGATINNAPNHSNRPDEGHLGASKHKRRGRVLGPALNSGRL